MDKKRWCLILCLVMAIPFVLTGMAQGKSVYLISDMNSNPPLIRAYGITGTSVSFQAENPIAANYSPAGIAIDPNAKVLFITSESDNEILLYSAVTFASLGTTTAAGASNLAGIAFDGDTNKLYVVDRGTSNLYVYDWTASTNTLTPDAGNPHALAGASAYGIALDKDNDLLYVANYSTTVLVFNTAGWTLADTLTLDHSAIGIAVDPGRGFLYTGNGWDNDQLNRYKLSDDTQTSVTVPVPVGTTGGVMGIGVDLDTGYIYCTTGQSGDSLLVYSSSLSLLHNEGVVGSAPTGVVVPDKEIQYQPEPIPTLSEWGMILLSLMLAGFAIWTMRRKKETAGRPS